MLSGIIYDARQLELAGISMLENVNKDQHFESFFTIVVSIKILVNPSSPAS